MDADLPRARRASWWSSGVMSHAASVAREYGPPCVSNVDGATGLLRDGDILRVDASRGNAEVVRRVGA